MASGNEREPRNSPHIQQPDKENPRRCRGRNRYGVHCKNWALKGSVYCKFHGGRLNTGKRKVMGGIYSKVASESLKERLTRLADLGEERKSLAEEVDLARVMCERSVSVYDKVVVQDVLAEKDELTEDQIAKAKDQASKSLQDSLKFVSDMVSAMAKLQVTENLGLGPDFIESISRTLTAIIIEELGEDQGRKIMDRIMEELTVGSHLNTGPVTINI